MRWVRDGSTQSMPAESGHCGIGLTDSGTKLLWLSRRQPNGKRPSRSGQERTTEDPAGRPGSGYAEAFAAIVVKGSAEQKGDYADEESVSELHVDHAAGCYCSLGELSPGTDACS